MRRVLLICLVSACAIERGGLAGAAPLGDAGACVPRDEACNALDEDCDGVVDEVAVETCGTELDEGLCRPGAFLCLEGVRTCEGAVLPAAEACETGLDEDCDGKVDEACGCEAGATEPCGASERGECRLGTRVCTDAGVFGACEGAVEPSAESCNGLDEDCDGETDEGLLLPFYRDADGDGFGLRTMVRGACAAPEGYVADDRDCDDACAECYPGREELCDDRDNDCDGEIEEGLVRTVYRDVDADRFGDLSMPMEACGATPVGYADRPGDCDDLNAGIQPLAIEFCDSRDQNCDGVADEGCQAECNRVELPTTRYHFCRAVRTWTDARDFCRSLRAELATIETGAENDVLREATQIVRGGEWWIGLNDRETEGTWRWQSGSTSTFRPWGSGEPNNLANEDCVELRGDGRWNDEGCNAWNPFVCEGAPTVE